MVHAPSAPRCSRLHERATVREPYGREVALVVENRLSAPNTRCFVLSRLKASAALPMAREASRAGRSKRIRNLG